MKKYIIASSKDWFQNSTITKDFEKFNFVYLNNKEDLELSKIEKINPRFIFFPHWSWIVPKDIHQNYECVAFHTSPLPYGRGGSPIQNLIARNFEKAPVCALKMNDILDGGPIYGTKEISLLGSGDQIFDRLSVIIKLMIMEIIENEPLPKEQVGEVTYFKRRTPSDSQLPKKSNILNIYNHIRMLDAKDYPKAFIDHGNLHIEFTDAVEKPDEVLASVSIRQK